MLTIHSAVSRKGWFNEIWKYDISGFAYSDSMQGRKNLGIFANEDLVVVTSRGADRLPFFRKDILSLPHGA
jgi:hypothetical protein